MGRVSHSSESGLLESELGREVAVGIGEAGWADGGGDCTEWQSISTGFCKLVFSTLPNDQYHQGQILKYLP